MNMSLKRLGADSIKKNSSVRHLRFLFLRRCFQNESFALGAKSF
jgi:hypothetical protein